MQQLAAGSQPGGVAPVASGAPTMQQQTARGEPDQLVGNLNNYVRSKLSKSEVPSFADTTRALAAGLNSSDSKEAKEVFTKVLSRTALFEALPPSILPALVSVRTKVDLPKTADRKLLRIVNYLVQLAAGEGSAGTVVPFSTLLGQTLPPTATDVFEYDALGAVYQDCKSESAAHYQRAAAFRALAALARSSMSSDPDDLTLVSQLMAIAATTLDRCDAARRRKAPLFGSNKKSRELDRRQTLERVAAQRAALAASRVGLPGLVLSSKIAPRAFGGVNSPDALCARHALAVAALAARDMPGMYVEQMGQLVSNSLEIWRTTGSLGGAERAAAIAAAASQGLPAPLRPTKELYQEKSLNLTDAWARLYLARGCAAVVHSGVGNSGPFWEMLVLLACCDKSTIVALEAIKGLAGASFPTATTLAAADGSTGGGSSSSSRRPVMLPDEHVEADVRVKCSMGWQLLLAHAGDEAPEFRESAAAAAVGPAAGATGKQSTMARVQQAPGIRHLTTLATDAAAAAGLTGSSAAPAPAVTGGSVVSSGVSLFTAVASRLLNCLNQTSHAAICSATRAVCALAEARAHAIAAARSPAERSALLGGDEVQLWMEQLEDRMISIASNAVFSAHMREKALEALLWFTQLPAPRDRPPLLAPSEMVQWMSTGGGTVSPAVRAIFADPWPEDVLSSYLLCIARRLLSAPAAASYLLGCAAAVATVAPSRVRQEQLHAMWDVCLRANNTGVKLAGLQSALAVMGAPTPAIAAPPSAASPEVKALASKEEAAMVALSRSAAWWLGENANFGAGEYAWAPRPLTPELVQQLAAADGCSQAQMAAAAVAMNPVLSLLIARLQRVMVTGLWEVRIAAAQALAKIAVRSGEPFRVQCYQILASAAGGSVAHRNRSSSRGGNNIAPAAVAGKAAVAAKAAAASAAAESAAGDPLGVAAVVGPALEVLDHMYASELIVEQLLSKYGPKRSAWPKKLLKNLEARNSALSAAIVERVGYVPKELFWPLGLAAKDVLTGRADDEEKQAKKKKEAEEAAAAAAAKAAADGQQPAGETATASTSAAAGAQEPAAAAAAAEDSSKLQRTYSQETPRAGEYERRVNPRTLLDKLQGYDYDPSAQHEEYPDDSISQVADDDRRQHSDDDSDVLLRRGTVLYDFTPEEEDEVSVSRGEAVEIEYEVGGWIQVIKRDGSRGLVPVSYVQIAEEDEDEGDVFSLAGRTDISSGVQGGQQAADVPTDFNAFLKGSSMRLRTRQPSIADSESSSAFSSMRQRESNRFRASAAEDVDDPNAEPVDALTMGRMMALVAQQGGDLDVALEQVDQLDSAARSGGAFNQPQYLHLKESLSSIIQHLNNLQVAGDARAMRRQMRDRALAGLDKLEVLQRSALSGAPFLSVAQSVAGDLPPAPSEVGGAAGGEEEFQYQPTKVRVLYAFDAEAEGELTVAVGDSLWVETEVDGWYQVVRDADGARGLVPTSYVDVEQF